MIGPSSPNSGVISRLPIIFLTRPSTVTFLALSRMIRLNPPSTPVMSSSVSQISTITTSGEGLKRLKKILPDSLWATTWQNQQNECAHSEDSDQPVHPPSLIRVFAVRSMGSQGPKVSSCGQRRLWSDWADAQTDLSLRWAHSHFVGFVMSRLIFLMVSMSVCFALFQCLTRTVLFWLSKQCFAACFILSKRRNAMIRNRYNQIQYEPAHEIMVCIQNHQPW